MSQLPSVKDLLAGERAAVEQLVRSSDDAWMPLIEHLLDAPEPAPAFVRSLWDAEPNFITWLRRIDAALGATQKTSSVGQGRKILYPWLLESLSAAFPESHQAVIEMRIQHLKTQASDDGGFEEAQRLYAQLAEHSPGPSYPAAAAVLAAKGAFTQGNFHAARQYATKAGELHKAAGNPKAANLAQRYLAGALLCLGEWEPALRLLDDVLATERGLMGDVYVSGPACDGKERVLQEAQEVAVWASHSTPEWVRAVGGLAEVFANEPIGLELHRRFEAGLDRIAQGSDPVEDLEVVIRQLHQRSYNRSAAVAETRIQAPSQKDAAP